MLDRVGIEHPSVTAVVDALGASRSRAYAAKNRLLAELPGPVRGPGRPATPDPPPVDTREVAAEVLDFVLHHPGCVHRGAQRTRYRDLCRCFVLELAERHREVHLQAFAAAAQVPIGTLQDWLAGGRADVSLAEPRNLAEVSAPATEPRIAAILAAWASWSGDLVPSCTHVQRDLPIPFGRKLIASILHAEGVRIPKKRRGRSPDAEATRDSFETFFANAQWVGDGKQLTVEIAGEVFTVHLEQMVDPVRGAGVGGAVREVASASSFR